MKEELKRLKGYSLRINNQEITLRDSCYTEQANLDELYFTTNHDSLLCKAIHLETELSLLKYRQQKHLYQSLNKCPQVATLLHSCQVEFRKAKYGLFIFNNIRRNGALRDQLPGFNSEKEILPVVRDLLHFLVMMEEKKLAYLGLNADNIFQTVRSGYCLINFDKTIAKEITLEQARENYFINEMIDGTHKHLAPEMLNPFPAKSIIGSKADVFCLGCVVYEMCYKQYPFPSSLAVVNLQYTIPTINSNFPILDQLVRMCLVDVARRPKASYLLKWLNVKVQQTVNSSGPSRLITTQYGSHNSENTYAIGVIPKNNPCFEQSRVLNSLGANRETEAYIIYYTGEGESAPQEKHIALLLAKIYRDKTKMEKISRLLNEHAQTRIGNPVVSLKILALIWNILRKGPKQIFESHCVTSTLREVVDLIAKNYDSATNSVIAEFCKVARAKLEQLQQFGELIEGNYHLHKLEYIHRVNGSMLEAMLKFLGVMCSSYQKSMFANIQLHHFVKNLYCDEMYDLTASLIMFFVCIVKDVEIHKKSESNLERTSFIEISLEKALRAIPKPPRIPELHPLSSLESSFMMYKYQLDFQAVENVTVSVFQLYYNSQKVYKNLILPLSYNQVNNKNIREAVFHSFTSGHLKTITNSSNQNTLNQEMDSDGQSYGKNGSGILMMGSSQQIPKSVSSRTSSNQENLLQSRPAANVPDFGNVFATRELPKKNATNTNTDQGTFDSWTKQSIPNKQSQTQKDSNTFFPEYSFQSRTVDVSQQQPSSATSKPTVVTSKLINPTALTSRSNNPTTSSSNAANLSNSSFNFASGESSRGQTLSINSSSNPQNFNLLPNQTAKQQGGSKDFDVVWTSPKIQPKAANFADFFQIGNNMPIQNPSNVTRQVTQITNSSSSLSLNPADPLRRSGNTRPIEQTTQQMITNRMSKTTYQSKVHTQTVEMPNGGHIAPGRHSYTNSPALTQAPTRSDITADLIDITSIASKPDNQRQTIRQNIQNQPKSKIMEIMEFDFIKPDNPVGSVNPQQIGIQQSGGMNPYNISNSGMTKSHIATYNQVSAGYSAVVTGHAKNMATTATSQTLNCQFIGISLPAKNVSSIQGGGKSLALLALEDEICKELKEQELKKLIKRSNVVTQYSKIQFIKNIGNGSTGEVFMGNFEGRVVAIKKVKSKQNATVFKQFQRELTTLIRIKKHQNLVTLVAVSKHNDDFYLLIDYCEGGNLFQLLHRRTDLDINWKIRVKIAKQIATAMNFLHSCNPQIIHRDLKSLNILIQKKYTSNDDNIVMKVTDFGLSRNPDAEFMTSALGTLHWMAPQLLQNKNYSLKVDVFSYGVVLWEIASRETPYKQFKSHLAILKYVTMEGGRPNMHKINQGCPGEFKKLMQKCWMLNEAQRPSFNQIIKILGEIQQTL